MEKQVVQHEKLTEFYKKFDFEITNDWIKENSPVYSVEVIDNGQIVAAATTSKRFGEYVLDYIGVASEYRHSGVGKVLVNDMLSYAKGKTKYLYLVAKTPAFFEKTGARYVSDKTELLGECLGCNLYNKTCLPKLMSYEVKMNIEDEIFIKSELLIYGVSVDENAKEKLLRKYPHFFEKGFVHAVNLSFGDTNVNVSVAEKFSKASKYHLYEKDGEFYIKSDKYDFKVEFFGALNQTNTFLDDMARLHCTNCINIWPSTNCCYDKEGIKCKFCSIVKETEEPIGVDKLAKSIKLLLENNKDGMLNFSGATYKSPDIMVDYWIELVKKIREFSNCKIAIEFAPPSDLNKLDELKKAGLDVAIMNLEIANPTLRKEICPGKAGISYEHYHKAFDRAVKVFGYGQVSSVLIGGLQPKQDIIDECEKMAKKGVFPTIMPYRPLDNCYERKETLCTPEDLREMSDKLGEMLVKYHLDFHKQEGCTKCGGCSIENDCYRLKMSKKKDA